MKKIQSRDKIFQNMLTIDQCFWVINDALRTFDEAQAECRVNGGNLARIPNSETYKILTK